MRMELELETKVIAEIEFQLGRLARAVAISRLRDAAYELAGGTFGAGLRTASHDANVVKHLDRDGQKTSEGIAGRILELHERLGGFLVASMN